MEQAANNIFDAVELCYQSAMVLPKLKPQKNNDRTMDQLHHILSTHRGVPGDSYVYFRNNIM
jgi:hypothetical protein